MTMTYLRHAILPVLGDHGVDAATRADIARWFRDYGCRRPGGANRVLDILRDTFSRAIAWGHRPKNTGNPCTGITRYRRPPGGRLLDGDGRSCAAGGGPVAPGARFADRDRDGAADPADRMPSRRGATVGLAGREARSARAFRELDGTEARLARRDGAGVVGPSVKDGLGRWVFRGALPGRPLREQAL